MAQLKTNADGTMSETIPYYSASIAYQEIALDGFPLYQSIQTHTEDNKKHVFFTDIEGGETLTCTSVYVVDDDCIDSSYLSFFRDIEALSEDGERIAQPYVKIR